MAGDDGPNIFWGPLEIPGEGCVAARLGTLALWGKRDAADWLFAADRAHAPFACPGVATEATCPAELSWQRWNADGDGSPALRPALPDRGVVVRPESALFILPGSTVDFYMSVPLWVTVVLAAKTDVTLLEQPSLVLSNTWFGTPESGELCYALRTRARRSFDPSEIDAHWALCPVRVRNGSDEQLHFERLCVRAPHLRLYAAEGCLWTNRATVTYRGGDEWSAVKYERTAPEEAGAAEPMTEPREATEQGVTLRSLASRAAARMGFVA